jgi:hypothetical protein
MRSTMHSTMPPEKPPVSILPPRPALSQVKDASRGDPRAMHRGRRCVGLTAVNAVRADACDDRAGNAPRLPLDPDERQRTSPTRVARRIARRLSMAAGPFGGRSRLHRVRIPSAVDRCDPQAQATPRGHRALPANADPQSLARIRETLTRSLGPQRDRGVLARTRPALRGDSRQALVARALVDATLALPASIGAPHWQTHAAAADPPLRTGA